MEWNNNLDVGVNDMNNQHKKILDLMNKMYDSYKNGDAFESYEPYLDELRSFTVQHFKEEEEFMESINFEGIAGHKQIHASLLETFQNHYDEIKGSKSLNDKFCAFLKLWLSAHIQGIDVKYGQVYNNQAA